MAGNGDDGVYLLDYGAGNVRSIVNAVEAVGGTLHTIQSAEDFKLAKKLIFPGVGAFGACMARLNELGYVEPLKEYIKAGKPFFGICLGMQTLFEGSDETPGVAGLGILPGHVTRFNVNATHSLSVPQIGWNGVNVRKANKVLAPGHASYYYFVHSFMIPLREGPIPEYVLTTTNYGVPFVSAVQTGNILACQFHPEKSGKAGLALLQRFLELQSLSPTDPEPLLEPTTCDAAPPPTTPAPRIIACLDVRSNDNGDIVVTKGDQYDVRESAGKKDVRNLGKPVELASRYYLDGADEITFLNITSFRNSPLKDQPMLEVLRQASTHIFVPLTIGGGIRDFVEPDGNKRTALQVASEYFRSGADKVSIGSDAVYAAEEYRKTGKKTGTTCIETISEVYGSQAVVISVDPRRVYVAKADDTKNHTFETKTPGPNGETLCWYQCTVKGGREARDLGAYELVQACEALGAGEILLNCIDKDGTNSGFNHELIRDVKSAVSIPVIASSGAGSVQHFHEVFQNTTTDAALAAGIFHRKEVKIEEVKAYISSKGIQIRV